MKIWTHLNFGELDLNSDVTVSTSFLAAVAKSGYSPLVSSLGSLDDSVVIIFIYLYIDSMKNYQIGKTAADSLKKKRKSRVVPVYMLELINR